MLVPSEAPVVARGDCPHVPRSNARVLRRTPADVAERAPADARRGAHAGVPLLRMRALNRNVRGSDAVLAALVAVVQVAGTVVSERAGSSTIAMDAPAYALLILMAAPLAARRRRPGTVLAAVAVVAFAYVALGYPSGFFTIALAVALYTVAVEGRRRAALGGLVGIAALFSGLGALVGRGHLVDVTSTLWFTGWLAASVALGEVVRGRESYLEQIRQRALEAERTRDEEARRRATEERMRIARELHDVLAHRISTIAVRSGVALHLLERQPEQAREALAAINESSRGALRELRETLGILRQVDEPEPRAPRPRLAQLDDLIERTREAGTPVRLEVAGECRELPTGVDLAAYRIIQESLTNVVRHAKGGVAHLAITYRLADLLIEVQNDTPAASPSGVVAGHGLQGMRERAAALGGELDAGPRPGGGFLVRARLPVARPS